MIPMFLVVVVAIVVVVVITDVIVFNIVFKSPAKSGYWFPNMVTETVTS